jgi:hypothetical protein
VKRITVIAEDKKGLIANLSELLAEKGINVLSINAQTDSGNAYIRLRVEPYDEALALLRDTGYQAVSDDVIVLRIKDEPGNLARIARKLTENGMDIRGVTMVKRSGDFCVVAVSTDDQEKAVQLLGEHLLDI